MNYVYFPEMPISAIVSLSLVNNAPPPSSVKVLSLSACLSHLSFVLSAVYCHYVQKSPPLLEFSFLK